MAKVLGYHRPDSVAGAVSLLGSRSAVPRIALAGGTVVNADRSGEPVEVVDLQAAGLSGITSSAELLSIGAMTTLQALADDMATPPLLADLAKRELPSALRTLATVGGTVAQGDPESELLAGLLAYGAEVSVATPSGDEVRPLGDVLTDGPQGTVITGVTLDPRGSAAAARTGRTPGDVPIVSAVGRSDDAGIVTVAMTGIAGVPAVVDDLDALDPPGDFRGTPEFRRRLARVLYDRVIREIS